MLITEALLFEQVAYQQVTVAPPPLELDELELEPPNLPVLTPPLAPLVLVLELALNAPELAPVLAPNAPELDELEFEAPTLPVLAAPRPEEVLELVP